MSRHIRELEATVGVSLFTRSARGLNPTDAALSLVDDARAMGDAAQTLTLKAQGRSQQLTGTVRITASVVVANLMLPPIFTRWRRAEPNIQIELVASDVAQNLLSRDADIAIRMFEPTQGALIARKSGEAPIGLFGHQSYFERRGRVDTVDDLLTHDVLGFDRSDAILKGYAANGLPARRECFPIRCDDQMVYWNLLMAGAGLGFAQTLLARRYPEFEQVPIALRLPPHARVACYARRGPQQCPRPQGRRSPFNGPGRAFRNAGLEHRESGRAERLSGRDRVPLIAKAMGLAAHQLRQ
jgi:DNA-binding transcriptional LysR family regulator